MLMIASDTRHCNTIVQDHIIILKDARIHTGL